jgi:hypothetical protein
MNTFKGYPRGLISADSKGELNGRIYSANLNFGNNNKQSTFSPITN